MDEIEELLLDKYLERELDRMEKRKHELEDEHYLYAKCVGIPNLKGKLKLTTIAQMRWLRTYKRLKKPMETETHE